jgi:hypothetical protein
MDEIKILGIDPSLRSSGIGILTYNSSLAFEDPKAVSVSHCQVLVNPSKYTGTDAILNMVDMLRECSEQEAYQNVHDVIIESPAIIFNKSWSGGAMIPVAHVAGACVALFGIEKARLFRPSEWNKSRKKEVTHNQTISVLGSADDWGYVSRVKEKKMEHVLDAISIALFWLRSTYLEE